jgi:hypothetical protein
MKDKIHKYITQRPASLAGLVNTTVWYDANLKMSNTTNQGILLV